MIDVLLSRIANNSNLLINKVNQIWIRKKSIKHNISTSHMVGYTKLLNGYSVRVWYDITCETEGYDGSFKKRHGNTRSLRVFVLQVMTLVRYHYAKLKCSLRCRIVRLVWQNVSFLEWNGLDWIGLDTKRRMTILRVKEKQKE